MKHSYAPVPKQIVMVACDRYQQDRQARIHREREEAIAAKMARKPLFPWSLFRSAPLTRDQAIAELKQTYMGFSPWGNIELVGRYWAEKVDDLRTLAMVATGVDVHVTAELAFLFRHMKATQEKVEP